ncbi:MAG: type II toxin-antitoxin system RelE/ParE family toxin [Thiomargarita sp.]|nr:type II toxin-antitoxin system RelE/ParE family toxin [Thiomargarita sp.]
MNWKVTFYNSKVEIDTLAFPTGILANFLHIAEMIETIGLNLGKPYIGYLGDGLYEIRARGKEGIGRSMYCTTTGKEVVILHSFIKKTQKTPKKDLNLAKKRMRDILK